MIILFVYFSLCVCVLVCVLFFMCKFLGGVYLSVCLVCFLKIVSLSFCTFICLFLCVSVCVFLWSVCLFSIFVDSVKCVCMSICLSIELCLSFYLVCLSACVCACLSISFSVCLLMYVPGRMLKAPPLKSSVLHFSGLNSNTDVCSNGGVQKKFDKLSLQHRPDLCNFWTNLSQILFYLIVKHIIPPKIANLGFLNLRPILSS